MVMRLDTLSYLRDLPLLSGVFLFLVLSFIFFFLLLRMYLVETSLISFFFFTFGVVLLAYFLPWVLLYFYLYLYTHCPFCPQRRCLCLMMRNSLRANRLRCRASLWRRSVHALCCLFVHAMCCLYMNSCVLVL